MSYLIVLNWVLNGQVHFSSCIIEIWFLQVRFIPNFGFYRSIWPFPYLILFSPICMTNFILEYTFFKSIWQMSYLILPNWPLMTKFIFQVVLLKFNWPNAILVLFQINPYLIMLNWTMIKLSWGLYYQIHTWIYFLEVCMTKFIRNFWFFQVCMTISILGCAYNLKFVWPLHGWTSFLDVCMTISISNFAFQSIWPISYLNMHSSSGFNPSIIVKLLWIF
jgi:hypothetical protein